MLYVKSKNKAMVDFENISMVIIYVLNAKKYFLLVLSPVWSFDNKSWKYIYVTVGLIIGTYCEAIEISFSSIHVYLFKIEGIISFNHYYNNYAEGQMNECTSCLGNRYNNKLIMY